MKLKNYFCWLIGALMVFLCGCGTTKNIDEEYLIINDISITNNQDNHNLLTLKIKGDYAESAWGIKNIQHEVSGNTIVITGTLESGGQGAFVYEVAIPPYIDSVRFYNRVLWARQQTDSQPLCLVNR